MPIDKIGSTEHYGIVKRNILQPRPQLQSVPQDDVISLTKAAKQNAEVLRVRDLALAAPDLRNDKLIELERRLQDPSYPDQTLIDSTADSLLDQWGL